MGLQKPQRYHFYTLGTVFSHLSVDKTRQIIDTQGDQRDPWFYGTTLWQLNAIFKSIRSV